MNISTRFTEFAMTGAFFWISQFIFFGFVHQDEFMSYLPQWMGVLYGYEVMIPKIFQGAMGSMLTAFGLIGIFVTGLIMDLLGVYFTPLERIILNRHLHRNDDWMDKITAECSPTVHDDYVQLKEHFGTGFVVSPKQTQKRFSLGRQCRRMQAFLFSYIHAFSSNVTSEILIDNVHLWRTTRAISTTLLFLGFEVLALYFHTDADPVSNVSVTVTDTVIYDKELIYSMMTAYALFLLSATLTLSAYTRMCFSLFTLACATRANAQRAKPK
ncbi:MAG: hypothetical protein GXP17_11575 [Gammaproteobacteria bacterium]|nr:hypothetical protein [Gammaproteobacteria bacterium]